MSGRILNFEESVLSSTVYENSYQVPNTKSEEQQLKDLLKTLKLEQQKYLQQKILSDIVEDVTNSGEIDSGVVSKIIQIQLNENLRQLSNTDKLGDSENNIALLGVNPSNPLFNYEEINVLQSAVKKKLLEDVDKLISSHPDWIELVESIDNVDDIKINQNDKVLIEYKYKLNQEQEKYVKNLLDLHEILESITNIRLSQLPKVMEEKVYELDLTQKINNLKYNLAHNKFNFDILTEIPQSLKAYKELVADINNQQNICQKEIENLNELKEKYANIAGNEFEEILQNYLRFKAQLERRSAFHRIIKGC